MADGCNEFTYRLFALLHFHNYAVLFEIVSIMYNTLNII